MDPKLFLDKLRNFFRTVYLDELKAKLNQNSTSVELLESIAGSLLLSF